MGKRVGMKIVVTPKREHSVVRNYDGTLQTTTDELIISFFGKFETLSVVVSTLSSAFEQEFDPFLVHHGAVPIVFLLFTMFFCHDTHSPDLPSCF